MAATPKSRMSSAGERAPSTKLGKTTICSASATTARIMAVRKRGPGEIVIVASVMALITSPLVSILSDAIATIEVSQKKGVGRAYSRPGGAVKNLCERLSRPANPPSGGSGRKLRARELRRTTHEPKWRSTDWALPPSGVLWLPSATERCHGAGAEHQSHWRHTGRR
jgi:hypothetical protein